MLEEVKVYLVKPIFTSLSQSKILTSNEKTQPREFISRLIGLVC